jgi:hypothetical protein
MVKHVVSTALVVLYALLGVFEVVQLLVLVRERHKKTGYKAVFHYLTLLWAILRAVFWVLFVADVDLPDIAFYLLFWVPQVLQYATFALLAVFLTKVTVRRTWSAPGGCKPRAWVVYGASAAGYAIGTLVAASLAAAGGGDDASYYANVQSLGSAIIFLFLSFVFALLAARLCGLPTWEYQRMFLSRQPRTISTVAVLVCVVFASRSVFNFLTFAKVIDIDIDRDDVATDLSAATVYFVWEFFPILLLLSTIAAGPRGVQRYKGRTGARGGGLGSVPTFGVFGAISAIEDDDDGGGGGGGGGGDGMGPDGAGASLNSMMAQGPGAGGGGGGGGAGGGGSMIEFSLSPQTDRTRAAAAARAASGLSAPLMANEVGLSSAPGGGGAGAGGAGLFGGGDGGGSGSGSSLGLATEGSGSGYGYGMGAHPLVTPRKPEPAAPSTGGPFGGRGLGASGGLVVTGLASPFALYPQPGRYAAVRGAAAVADADDDDDEDGSASTGTGARSGGGGGWRR